MEKSEFQVLCEKIDDVRQELRDLKDIVNPKIAEHGVRIEMQGESINTVFSEIRHLKNSTQPQKWTIANTLMLLALLSAVAIAVFGGK